MKVRLSMDLVSLSPRDLTSCRRHYQSSAPATVPASHSPPGPFSNLAWTALSYRLPSSADRWEYFECLTQVCQSFDSTIATFKDRSPLAFKDRKLGTVGLSQMAVSSTIWSELVGCCSIPFPLRFEMVRRVASRSHRIRSESQNYCMFGLFWHCSFAHCSNYCHTCRHLVACLQIQPYYRTNERCLHLDFKVLKAYDLTVREADAGTSASLSCRSAGMEGRGRLDFLWLFVSRLVELICQFYRLKSALRCWVWRLTCLGLLRLARPH